VLPRGLLETGQPDSGAIVFLASKLLSFLTHPIAWAILLLAASLLLSLLQRSRRTGRALSWAALLVLLLAGWQGPADLALHQLETRYQPVLPGTSLKPYAGMVVLGGALDRSQLWERPGQMALNGHAERMVMPLALMRRYPHLKLVFTGGEGSLSRAKFSEADRAKKFFDLMGVDPEKVLYESESRTTYDNAIMTARLPGVDPAQPWLLVTTAAHMPRSMGVFQKAGWNVTAYPVDFRTADLPEWTDYAMTQSVEKWHYALHETLGYLAYWLAGRL
jgi:uncharacterized SAM-binding protein YcdF (DUF218 family)